MLDARTLTKLERLFDLQMWAFGCDARHTDGNLFARRGMQRTPAPEGSGLSSTWSELNVSLSSLGLRVTRGERSLFLQRGPLAPQLRDQSVELLADLAAWVLAWEAWVDQTVSDAWRDEALASRRRPAPWNARELRALWAELLQA
ncbi:MAG: hypothetical protein DI536_09770 [Archangium gephyra]|uniref:Uncharacterized protein n=1 Tax=Archangium gephyra TaxID=48 RepID=A0A2W5TJU1_9BACT|nr:MAG: hypothetical protein DI536_09770 [Archangium gephyra]